MNITRREMLRFAGGSVFGLLLTPIPWKVLDDSAIWTQNWPWIPEPKRGGITYKTLSCSLCPAACGMRARCVGNQPVSLSGLPSHPMNQGALCPIGVVAHHLRYHPARISRTLRIAGNERASQTTALSLNEALREVVSALKDANERAETIAVVDSRPGRTTSLVLQQFAANTAHGVYIAAGDESLGVLASMFAKPVGTLGYDVDRARTVLSFGVPLFDGWGTPARTARYLDGKSAGRQQILQVESFRTRTAELADRWIAIRPGTEAVFALGVAHDILQEKVHGANARELGKFADLLAEFTPAVVSDVCGISQESIFEVARVFAAQTPSIAIARGAGASREVQHAVMVLNLVAGNVGKSGGVAVKRDLPSTVSGLRKAGPAITDLSSIPDHSVRVMLIDESLSGCDLPDARMLRKLIPGKGIIVSLSPFVTERPFCTQYVIPTPVFLESMEEMSNAVDVPVSTLSLSAPLVPAPIGVLDPIEFVQRLAQSAGIKNVESGTKEELLKKRVTAIHAERRGNVFDVATGQTNPVSSLSSANDLWNALIAGGCWMDAPSTERSLPAVNLSASLPATTVQAWKSRAHEPLLLVPVIQRDTYGATSVSPLMSKVGQESGLRPYGNLAFINPRTASDCGLIDHEGVSLQTNNGSFRARARFDASIMPGVIALTATDPVEQRSVAALCEMNVDATIRPTSVRIQKV